MFCPSCRAEFQAGVGFCKNCEVDLITELPDISMFKSPESMADALGDKELTPVIAASQDELQRMQRRLADQQILSVLAFGQSPSPGVAPRLYLMVATEDIPRMGEFLNEMQDEQVVREGVVKEVALGEVTLCPACEAEAPMNAEECPDCGLMLGLG
ncbi:MAG: hypothetical protein VX699_09600 [Myxococcota bacterium]|nr:hypothetical protein [Myxococcota bacterium]